MKIRASTIYFTDNGLLLCGEHLGMTAKATGRDTSGQRIVAADVHTVRECIIGYGYVPTCETCGKKAAIPANVPSEHLVGL